jgi:hypothetical protein
MTSAEDLFAHCDIEGGCLYLRNLSTLERLVGCPQTAKFYERTADRCARQGCWALLVHLRDVASPRLPYHMRFPLNASRAARQTKGSSVKRCASKVIPFVRSDVADVVSDHLGNFVERRALKPGTLRPAEPLGYIYDYWRWLRNVTRCQLSDIDTMHLMRAGIVGNLHLIDVASVDPADFRLELTGYRVPLGLPDKPSEFHVAIYANAVLQDYNTVRLTAVPRLQRVRAGIGHVYHHYLRLILPLFDERQRVSRLLVAIRQEADNGTLVKPRRQGS